MTLLVSTVLAMTLAAPFDFAQNIAIDTGIRMLETTPMFSTAEAIDEHAYLEKRIPLKRFNWKFDYYLIFRYRDSTFFDQWERMLRERPENDLIKIWYINALEQMGRAEYLQRIARFNHSSNDIIRECAANAYGFLAPYDSIKVLESWLSAETNGYVQKTIKASIAAIRHGGYKSRIPYLPTYYPGRPLKIQFIYNRNIDSDSTMHFYTADSTRSATVAAGSFIYPFQQYLWRIKNAQKSGFFGSKHGPIYHIGTDAGWFFEGVPVHAICNGRVKSIAHNLSWGTIIVIETILPSNDTACVLYGHLSPFLSLNVGDTVTAGDRIGQIGNSVSFDNGGYWAHLHLGIETRSFRRAGLTGYDIDTTVYENPVALIRKYSNPVQQK